MALSSIGVKSLSPINSTLFSSGSSVQPDASSPATWEVGTNQSTSLVNVTYTQSYMSSGVFNYSRTMTLSYNDKTQSSIQFGFFYIFNTGGIDITHQQVLNWTKLNLIDFVLTSFGTVNGTRWTTDYNFNGFYIVSGTAKQFTLVKSGNSTPTNPNSFAYNPANVVGSIVYSNCSSAEIGAVTLSTVNTVYNGQAVTDSVATFNITLTAQIMNIKVPLGAIGPGNTLPPHQTLSNVPVVLMFQVIHDVYHTQYKYGVSINWSINKAFPAAGLQNGASYCLDAQDVLGFNTKSSNSTNSNPVFTFSSDTNNDSAIYTVNGTVLCRELFPTNYTITGSPQVQNTTRIYLSQASYGYSQGIGLHYSSEVYVCFGGFVYNQSTGFSFDPTVIAYNSGSSTSSTTTSSTSTTSSTKTSTSSSTKTASTTTTPPTTTSSTSTTSSTTASTSTTTTISATEEAAIVVVIVVVVVIIIAGYWYMRRSKKPPKEIQPPVPNSTPSPTVAQFCNN